MVHTRLYLRVSLQHDSNFLPIRAIYKNFTIAEDFPIVQRFKVIYPHLTPDYFTKLEISKTNLGFSN